MSMLIIWEYDHKELLLLLDKLAKHCYKTLYLSVTILPYFPSASFLFTYYLLTLTAAFRT